MFVKNKKHQERSLFDTVNQMPPVMRERLDKSWAAVFYQEIFTSIDESIFSVLYSDIASRPNSAVNVLVAAELLKAHFHWSDEQLFNECAFNLQVRYALGSCDFDGELFSERTLYNFRDRLSRHFRNTDENLIARVFEKLTEDQLKRFAIKSATQRMDSTQVSSNIRSYSRIGLLVELISRFHHQLTKQDQERYKNEFSPYVSGSQNAFCYRLSSDDLDKTLAGLGIFIAWILNEFKSGYSKNRVYNLLERVFDEHFENTDDSDDPPRAKPSDQLPGNSLRSPDDEDATVTHKAGKNYFGYVINASETCDESNPFNLITQTSVANNRTSDSALLNECLEDLVKKTGLTTLLTDATYSSKVNDHLSKDLGLTHLQSAIRGREHHPHQIYLSDFQFTTQDDQFLITCPNGQQTLVEAAKKEGNFMAAFPHHICNECPLLSHCNSRSRIRGRVLYFSETEYLRAIRWQNHLAYRKGEGNPRAGVERLMGLFKFRLPNGKLPVRGMPRVAQYVFATAIMLNFRRIFNHIRLNGLDNLLSCFKDRLKRLYRLIIASFENNNSLNKQKIKYRPGFYLQTASLY